MVPPITGSVPCERHEISRFQPAGAVNPPAAPRQGGVHQCDEGGGRDERPRVGLEEAVRPVRDEIRARVEALVAGTDAAHAITT